MNNTITIPIYGFLTAGRKFNNKLPYRTSYQCIRKLGNRHPSIKCQSTHRGNAEKLSKNLLGSLVKKPFFNQARMFSVNTSKTRTQLMDLEIATTPGFFNSIIKSINTLLIKNYDEEFEMNEFVDNTKTALVVVAKLLSESKFSELEGLLTRECLAQVERNVKAMEPAQRYNLAVNLDDIFFLFPYQANIIRGGNNGEKIHFQVTVVYHICKNFSNIMEKHPWVRIAETKIEMLTVYNCRFIKEFTKGSNDQWIMNGINIYKMHEDPMYQQHQQQQQQQP